MLILTSFLVSVLSIASSDTGDTPKLKFDWPSPISGWVILSESQEREGVQTTFEVTASRLEDGTWSVTYGTPKFLCNTLDGHPDRGDDETTRLVDRLASASPPGVAFTVLAP